MGINRWATRKDTTQAAIVEAIRAAGWLVEVIHKGPFDLACWHPSNIWQPLECKSPRNKKGEPKIDKRQVKQNEFCNRTFIPRVTTPEQAVEFLNRRLGR